MGRFSKRCSMSSLDNFSRWIKSEKEWSSFSPSFVCSDTSEVLT